MILVSVHDRVSGEYSPPYLFVSIDDAERKLACAYRSNPFVRDLDAYYVGSFDTSIGTLYPWSKDSLPVFINSISGIIAEVDNA